MELVNNEVCKAFSFAGKVYQDVTIEKIEKLELPCYFNGTDYLPLTPKDTECSFNYFRLLNEEPIYVDTGHCSQSIRRIKKTYKWVCFFKEKSNIETLFLKFQSAFNGHLNLKIQSIERDPNKLMKSECKMNFDVRLKGMLYFSIDFTISEKYNNCLTDNCQ
jgi:hypothetical protein